MLSKDVAIVNGMVRTMDSIKTKDADKNLYIEKEGANYNGYVLGVSGDYPQYIMVRHGVAQEDLAKYARNNRLTITDLKTRDAESTPIFSEQGYKINKWPSGVFTVETPKYPVMTFHNLEEANRALTYRMKKDGVYGKGQKDSKTRDGEDQTIGNYNGYHIVFNGGFIRAQEDGFTKIEFPSSMGAGGWSRADVQKMFDKIDARRSGMKDSKTKDAGNCSNYRSDTESCRTGCKRIRVNPGEACPFDLETERGRWPGDFQADCPCYK